MFCYVVVKPGQYVWTLPWDQGKPEVTHGWAKSLLELAGDEEARDAKQLYPTEADPLSGEEVVQHGDTQMKRLLVRL